jgi:phosphoglycolate phosphatase
MQTFQGILFDLDGTLLDSLEDLARSMNSVLRQYHFPTHEIAAYRYFVGDGMETLVRRTLPSEVQGQAVIQECLSAMGETYARQWDRKTRPYPGVPELLDGLESLSVPKVILSNKPHDFTRQMVQKLLAPWRFDLVEGARPEVPKKPDPAGALRLAKNLGIRPENFLYLGDTNTDMQTAVAAKMYPVGALWGFRTAEELRRNGAKSLVENPVEILRYFEKQ